MGLAVNGTQVWWTTLSDRLKLLLLLRTRWPNTTNDSDIPSGSIISSVLASSAFPVEITSTPVWSKMDRSIRLIPLLRSQAFQEYRKPTSNSRRDQPPMNTNVSSQYLQQKAFPDQFAWFDLLHCETTCFVIPKVLEAGLNLGQPADDRHAQSGKTSEAFQADF